MSKQLILASSSPRRKILLTQLNLSFICVNPNIDETPIANEKIIDYVKRMAIEKAHRGYQMVQKKYANQSAVILGSDTCGEIDGACLAKPKNNDDAIALLQKLSGKSHYIHSAYSLYDGHKIHTQLVTSTVTMRDISDAEIKAYCETGEPSDKAGAYAIQGIGAQFVSHLEGSYSAVMGLPLCEVSSALKLFQIKTL